MVPAEHERKRAALRRRPHLLGDSLAGLADLGEEAGFLVPGVHRLADARVDVAPVLRRDPELDEALAQPGVSNRGRAHVHAAAARAEVELGPDDCNAPFALTAEEDTGEGHSYPGDGSFRLRKMLRAGFLRPATTAISVDALGVLRNAAARLVEPCEQVLRILDVGETVVRVVDHVDDLGHGERIVDVRVRRTEHGRDCMPRQCVQVPAALLEPRQ